MKSKEKHNNTGGISFLIGGIIVALVPALFFVILGDFIQLANKCSMPFDSVDIGNNTIVDCTQIRFVYVLSYFCLLLGSILIILGIAKKIIEQKSSKKS